MMQTVSLSIPTLLAMTQIVTQHSLQTTCRIFSMLVSVVEVQGLPAFHKSLVPFTNSCSGHGRISINITQHLQSLSHRFSKFATKFIVNFLLNHHSAIELPIVKKLKSDLAQQLFTSNQSHSPVVPKKQK